MVDAVSCSFCGLGQHEVSLMLAGPVLVFICSDCIIAASDQVVTALRDEKRAEFRAAQSDRSHVPGLSTDLASIINRATRQMSFAKEAFPAPNYTALKVAEEAGEVIKAAVHYAEGRAEWSDVEAEAVQAIAMILRLVDEGDSVNGIHPPQRKVVA